MIARLIELCVRNRLLVLLLAGFLVAGGAWATQRITIDAIPDLSDVQVVIRTEYPGQAPQIVEDGVTYPLTTAMLAVPGAETVRGYSMFGTSFVYILFEDGTDLYWARSRVLEQLSTLQGRLPAGVNPQLGPDATGVGWVFQYVLTTGPYCPEHPGGLWHDPLEDAWYAEREDAPEAARERLVRRRVFPGRETCPLSEPRRVDAGSSADSGPTRPGSLARPGSLVQPDIDLAGLRSLQDWYLRYELTAVEGVSEVAAVGGFVKQYQVTVDPVKLQAYDLPLAAVSRAIRRANMDVGGRVIEQSETEYMVRGLGYLGTGAEEGDRTQAVLEDLRRVGLAATPEGSPITLADVATIGVGPDIRRGIAEWNGTGEVVGGTIVMRFGENARDVIDRVKEKLADLEQGLPPGVAVEVAYDRSDLIERAVHTVSETLLEEILVVSLVTLLFLLHARSALVAACVLPAGVLTSILIMWATGVNANIMSLGGIAISIGVMVDSSIVMVENAHKHLEEARRDGGTQGRRDEEDQRRSDEATKRRRDAGDQARRHAGTQGRRGETGRRPSSTSLRPSVPSSLRTEALTQAAKEVGPTLFFSLLIITVSFLPIFVLPGQSGRLFTPLAITKTLAIAAAAVLAVTLIPVLMTLFIRERGLLDKIPIAIAGPLRGPGLSARATATTEPRPGPGGRILLYATILLAPGVTLALIPLGDLTPWRWWLAPGVPLLSAILLLPQRIVPEHRNPISRILQRLYDPAFALVMRFKAVTLLLAAALLASTLYPWSQLGSEFMPPLEEGDLLYMPTTDPGLSVTKARELLQQTDKLIAQFPEVDTVFGKIGRAETATDPAPLTMIETTITLHRDPAKWRHVPITRFYTNWPGWVILLPDLFLDDTRPITQDELVYGYTIPASAPGNTANRDITVPGLNDAINLPGVANAWTMPIKTRLDMLSTGIKTPVGIKLMGDDLAVLGRLADEVGLALRTDPRTAGFTASAFADQTVGGRYLDITPDRDRLSRYDGLTLGDVQDTLMSALGGMTVDTTVEGLQRYPINVRYPRELRDDIQKIRDLLVTYRDSAGNFQALPLGQLADVRITVGPPMIKSENARRTAWVFVDIRDIDLGSYVERAQSVVGERVQLPPGYSLAWSGEFEHMQEGRSRLIAAGALAAALIVLLLYAATRSWLRVGIVLLAVPFSLVGGLWLVWFLDYEMSYAVWVGIIALAGLDAETGLVMLLYLDNSHDRFKREGRMNTPGDLYKAVHDGAVQRIRPKTMTVVTSFAGLLPLMWATGAGADTMRRLAAPMVGGLATSFLLELLLYPILFYYAKRVAMWWHQRQSHPSPGL